MLLHRIKEREQNKSNNQRKKTLKMQNIKIKKINNKLKRDGLSPTKHFV
jgi:hypothetical protein